MADIILNGTTYSSTPAGGANPWRPSKISMKAVKYGSLKRAANGSLTWVHLGIKREWTINWEKADEATRAAVRALHELTATFAFTDQLGVAYTVLSAEADHGEDTAFAGSNGAQYYDLSIVLRQV